MHENHENKKPSELTQGSLFESDPGDADAQTGGDYPTPEQGAEIDKYVDQGLNYPQAFEKVGLPYPSRSETDHASERTDEPQLSESDSTQSQNQEGVSVSLRDYYLGLQGLAKLRPRINTNANYLTQTAEAGTPIYNKLARDAQKIDSDIETEIGKKQETRDRLEKAAKNIFATSIFAKDEMVKAGLIDEKSARQLAKRTYDEYTSTYFNPKNKKLVAKHERKINRRLKELGEN